MTEVQSQHDRHAASTSRTQSNAAHTVDDSFSTQGGRYRHKTTDEQTRDVYSPEEYQKRYRHTLDDTKLSQPQPTTATSVVSPKYATPRRVQTSRQSRAQQRTVRNRKTVVKKLTRTKISFAIKSLIWGVHILFWMWQLVLGVLLVIMIGLLALGESTFLTRSVVRVYDTVAGFVFGSATTENMLAIVFVLGIAIGWSKLAIIFTILKFISAKPLFGSRSDIKVPLFLCAFFLYTVPLANLVPWSMLWSWYVLRHPQ